MLAVTVHSIVLSTTKERKAFPEKVETFPKLINFLPERGVDVELARVAAQQPVRQSGQGRR